MRVAYKQGERVRLPKAKTRKEEVEEMAQYLMAKWRVKDRIKAEKIYNHDRYNRL